MKHRQQKGTDYSGYSYSGAISNRGWSYNEYLHYMLAYVSCLSYRRKNEQDLERSHDMLQRELRALLEMEGKWTVSNSNFSNAPVIKKITSFFFRFWKCVCLFNTWLAKFWALIFIERPVTVGVSFGFYDPPSLACETDWLDLRWLDPGKNDVKGSLTKNFSVWTQLIIYAMCEF